MSILLGLVLAAVVADSSPIVDPTILTREPGERWSTNAPFERLPDHNGFPAIRLRVSPPENPNPWSVVTHVPTIGNVLAGDTIYVRLWARSPDRARLGINFEQTEPPHTKFVTATVRLTPEWAEYRIAGTCPTAFDVGRTRVALFHGYTPATVDIAGIRVESYGDLKPGELDSNTPIYDGEQATDAWRSAAKKRIREVRTGPIEVTVTDRNGKPLAGQSVRVRMTRQHFRWGTAGPARRLVADDPDNRRYQEYVARFFNTYTFENDLKWPASLDHRNADVDAALPWLEERGFNVRGHNIVWGDDRWMPFAIGDFTAQELTGRLEERAKSITRNYRGRLYGWDVVNEARDNTQLWEKIGWDKFVEVHRWAREGDPEAKLIYNDYNIINEGPHGPGPRARVKELVRMLRDSGAPLDLFGIQGHMFVPLTTPPRIVEILDEMAQMGLPMEITEFDAGVWDDRQHGTYVRDVLLACFSHPGVEAFILWGFWENSHWRSGDGGHMVNADWSHRPAMDAWIRLVRGEFWTDETLKTDAQGRIRLRGFYGDYEITSGGTKAAASFEPGQTIRLTLQR